MIKKLFRLFLLIFVVSHDPVASKSIVEYCPPYTSFYQLALDLRKPFIQYYLDIEKVTGGRKAVSITGDLLIVDRETLGALVTTAKARDPSVQTIKLSGRVVRISGSLPLEYGSIEITADEIVFDGGSSIIMLPDKSSSITLAARTLRLSQSGFRHFDIRARQRSDDTFDDFADIKTILTVMAEDVYRGPERLAESDTKSELAHRFSRYPITDFSTKVEAFVGADGRARWQAYHRRVAASWPSYSVAVLRAAFRIAPFDRCSRSEIEHSLQELMPSLEAVGGAEDNFTAQVILDSIARGIDLEGNGPAYVTAQPLSGLLSDLGGFACGSSGKTCAGLGSLRYYRELLRASLEKRSPDAAMQSAQVRSTSESIRLIKDEIQTSNDEMTRLTTSISQVEEELRSQNAAYQERKARLVNRQVEIEKGGRKRSQVISALSAGAALATTAITGIPQSGAAVGGVLYGLGMAGEGKKPLQSIAAGIDFALAIEGPLASVKNALSDLNKSRQAYQSFVVGSDMSSGSSRRSDSAPATEPASTSSSKARDRSLFDLMKSGKKARTSVESLLDVYKNFAPPPTSVDTAVEDDRSLKDIANGIAETLKKVDALTNEADRLQRIAQDQDVKLVTLGEQIDKLTRLPVQNEARRRLFTQWAIQGARDESAKFAKLVDYTQRVSIVEYRAPPPVNVETLQTLYVDEAMDASFRTKAILNEEKVGESYIKLLDARIELIDYIARYVISASKRQFSDYIQLRGTGPIINAPAEEITSSPGSPADERKFIQELNNLISEQYRFRNDAAKLADLQQRRLEIPFDLRTKVVHTFPVRLLQVAVTDFSPRYNLNGSDITFRVEVDRVGNLRVDRDKLNIAEVGTTDAKNACSVPISIASVECFSVDLRPKSASPDLQFRPFEQTVGQIKSGTAYRPTRQQSFWYLNANDTRELGRSMMVAYPPAEARMYLKVRLDPRASWSSPPVLSRVTILVEVFQ